MSNLASIVVAKKCFNIAHTDVTIALPSSKNYSQLLADF